MSEEIRDFQLPDLTRIPRSIATAVAKAELMLAKMPVWCYNEESLSYHQNIGVVGFAVLASGQAIEMRRKPERWEIRLQIPLPAWSARALKHKFGPAFQINAMYVKDLNYVPPEGVTDSVVTTQEALTALVQALFKAQGPLLDKSADQLREEEYRQYSPFPDTELWPAPADRKDVARLVITALIDLSEVYDLGCIEAEFPNIGAVNPNYNAAEILRRALAVAKEHFQNSAREVRQVRNALVEHYKSRVGAFSGAVSASPFSLQKAQAIFWKIGLEGALRDLRVALNQLGDRAKPENSVGIRRDDIRSELLKDYSLVTRHWRLQLQTEGEEERPVIAAMLAVVLVKYGHLHNYHCAGNGDALTKEGFQLADETGQREIVDAQLAALR